MTTRKAQATPAPQAQAQAQAQAKRSTRKAPQAKVAPAPAPQAQVAPAPKVPAFDAPALLERIAKLESLVEVSLYDADRISRLEIQVETAFDQFANIIAKMQVAQAQVAPAPAPAPAPQAQVAPKAPKAKDAPAPAPAPTGGELTGTSPFQQVLTAAVDTVFLNLDANLAPMRGTIIPQAVECFDYRDYLTSKVHKMLKTSGKNSVPAIGLIEVITRLHDAVTAELVEPCTCVRCTSK